MKIYLPNSAFIGNIDPFLKSLDLNNKKKLNLSAHKKWVFVHPVVLSMVAALGLTVDSGNISCEKIEAKSGHYLESMGMFSFLKIPSNIIIKKHESAGRFIKISQIKNSVELTRFLTDMIPLLHLEQKQASSIRYIVSELVRNVLEHANTKYGAIVSAQYHKKSNTMRIGIVDTGVGIKSTINQSYPAKNDLEAIKLALSPGITGTTKKEGGTEFNAGAGLFFIKSIASVNRSYFMVYSGNALYKLLKRSQTKKTVLYADPQKDNHSERLDLPYWKGTVVGIDISLNETHEFTLLLELIKQTYSKAMKERKKARYKKARFI